MDTLNMQALNKYRITYFLISAMLISCHTKKELSPAELINLIPNNYFENKYIGVNLPTAWLILDSDLPSNEIPENVFYDADFYKGSIGSGGSHIHLMIFIDSIKAMKYQESRYALASNSWNPQGKFDFILQMGAFTGNGFVVETKMIEEQITKVFSGRDFRNNYITILEFINKENSKSSKDEISLIENTLSIKAEARKYEEESMNGNNYAYYSKDWIHIYDSDDGNSYFINSFSNKTNDGTIQIWVKQTDLANNKFELVLHEVNCIEKKMKVLLIKTYSSSGELIAVINPHDVWRHWELNTIAGILLEAIRQRTK